jgi:hypothetical protein
MMSKVRGYPKFHWFGEDTGYRYLVMSHLGLSLDFYLENFGAFSLNTVLIIAL